jgi:hypothetical protein
MAALDALEDEEGPPTRHQGRAPMKGVGSAGGEKSKNDRGVQTGETSST